MNSRAEKPHVPTPDAAEVYEHHLSQMSRPMRTAVERYVDPLIEELMLFRTLAREHVSDGPDLAGRLRCVIAGFETEHESDEQTAGLLADICDAAFGDPARAEAHGYAGVLERVRELVAAASKPCWNCGIDGGGYTDAPCSVCHGTHVTTLPHPASPPDHEATPPREAVPDAVVEPWPADAMKVPPDWDLRKDGNWVHEPTGARVCKNTDGRWDYSMGSAGPEYSCGGFFDSAEEALLTVTRNLNGRTPLERAADRFGAMLHPGEGWTWAGMVCKQWNHSTRAAIRFDDDKGNWMWCRADEPGFPAFRERAPDIREAARLALTPADAVPQPDGGASGEADPHGLGAGWSRGEWALPPESWRHVSGARILKDSGGSGWFGMDANGHDAHHGYVPTAREAAALALGPLPTPAPAAVAGEVELDWNAVRKCGGPMSGMCETQDVVRMLREYHTQLTARLAALEARR
jgi:hypothetical protein